METRRSFRLSPLHSAAAGVALFIVMAASLLVAQQPARTTAPPDAIAQAQQPAPAAGQRPEQVKTPHDLSPIFSADQALSSSTVNRDQPKQGKLSGFDFARDPLGAEKPNENPDEIMKRLLRANLPSWRRSAACWSAGTYWSRRPLTR